MISKSNAEHYVWGDKCDGWYLVNRQDMLVIHEKMPQKRVKSDTNTPYPGSFFRSGWGSDHGTGKERASYRCSAEH